ncbi:SDR family NAD(P)-dependent oxidoreductase [Psychrobacter sp. HD31]|uniref:SDR family NAD(P)-dependent oxidoreductase n=1 Tax=Psychrobacter sp. HD31 TaxID=3112003 RepID=UPI003DA25AA1
MTYNYLTNQYLVTSERQMTKRILITGATSGIGYQLVIDYLNAGHYVYAVGRNQTVLQQLKQLGAMIIIADLTDRNQAIDSIQNMLQQTPLDVVICCAGICQYVDITHINSTHTTNSSNSASQTINTMSSASSELLGFDSAKIMDVMNTNFGTLVHTIEAVLPYLQQSKGRLVALGSASAFVPFVRAEAYASSKSAVHYLIKTLQLSLKPYDIDVSLVIPGFVDTPMTAQNDFDMPFLQTVEQASQAIRKGIENGEDVIEFPKRLTVPLKTLGMLPNVVWERVSDRLNK